MTVHAPCGDPLCLEPGCELDGVFNEIYEDLRRRAAQLVDQLVLARRLDELLVQLHKRGSRRWLPSRDV